MSLKRSRSRNMTATWRRSLAARRSDGLETVHEQLAIRERRQRIVDGRMSKALAQRSTLGDVLDLTDEVEGSLLVVANAGYIDRYPHVVAVSVAVALLDSIPVRVARGEASHFGLAELSVIGVGEGFDVSSGKIVGLFARGFFRGQDLPG